MITLTRKMREVEDGPLIQPLPKGCVPLKTISQLYQHVAYVCVPIYVHDNFYKDKENEKLTYIPLQYICEDSCTIDMYSGKKETSHIITCRALDGDLRTIQFTKGYVSLLIQRGLIYSDPNSVRNQEVTW